MMQTPVKSVIVEGNITLLRIKRKRTDEPLDALVVDLPDNKRKRESAAGGVFTFAETIEEDAFFEDQQATELLHKRITELSRGHSQQQSPKLESKETSPVPAAEASPASVRSVKPLPRSYSIVDSKSSPGYTVAKPTKPTAPPIVASSTSRLKPGAPNNVTMYDAVPMEDMPHGGKSLPDHTDHTMDEFASMVNDYLRLNDISLEPAASSPPRSSAPSPPNGKIASGGDYVYDVFYFRRENKDDVEALVAREAANVGTVSGLPPWEIYDYVPDDSDADSVPDEADEDSNEENFYRNDYPDDEVSDEEGWDF